MIIKGQEKLPLVLHVSNGFQSQFNFGNLLFRLLCMYLGLLIFRLCPLSRAPKSKAKKIRKLDLLLSSGKTVGNTYSPIRPCYSQCLGYLRLTGTTKCMPPHHFAQWWKHTVPTMTSLNYCFFLYFWNTKWWTKSKSQ
jgi:hypothetical protein